LQQWDPALSEFDEVLRQGGKDPSIFCAKGLVLMEQRKSFEAVHVFHEALAISPQDAIATELLNKALEETAGGAEEFEEDEEFERELAAKKEEAGQYFANKKKGKEKFRPRISSGIGLDGNSLMELSDDE
jgi:anaphase-promoting complex subunit 6